MNLSLTGLTVLREVAEAGSFSEAALTLRYSQSAVSRQVAALEREAGQPLFERLPSGVRLTTAGVDLLGHANAIFDELAQAAHDLGRIAPAGADVRLGVFISAGAVLLPRAIARLRASSPHVTVTTREGTTPGLVRALRAGSLDLAILSSRPPFHPPDGEQPPLHATALCEIPLLVAVPTSSPLAEQDELRVQDLDRQPWIATRARAAEPLLGVWPTLGGRPRIVHTAGDWTSKLAFVAAGCGITTIPGNLLGPLPGGIRALPVRAEPPERRRILVAQAPGAASDAITRVIETLKQVGGSL